ncbi:MULTISPECIES: DedA family protein [Thiomicrorhabdus]|uniref:DedA family protein n=1 Tax=Thiomicrorhabdus heinhorstiae TaxID=2748010 RepID=A0ABS0BVT1_9GAMM|nr:MULTISPECIES: DedA family protein [Thiomicrorhabdus]MBF6057074.1 DedA family protein [Thiomicrorhabdus heinhorstiae]
MDFEGLIAEYGYLAVFIGSFLEGETALILGGFLAHNGHLLLQWVMISAALGSFLGDQLYYYIGRYKGKSYLESKPLWKQRSDKIFDYLNRHPVLFILGFRFMYGLRTVAPFVIGASGFPPLRYTILNIIGVTIWAIVIGSLGYYLGRFAEQILNDVQKYEMWILGFIALAAFGYWIYRMRKTRREALIKASEDDRQA